MSRPWSDLPRPEGAATPPVMALTLRFTVGSLRTNCSVPISSSTRIRSTPGSARRTRSRRRRSAPGCCCATTTSTVCCGIRRSASRSTTISSTIASSRSWAGPAGHRRNRCSAPTRPITPGCAGSCRRPSRRGSSPTCDRSSSNSSTTALDAVRHDGDGRHHRRPRVPAPLHRHLAHARHARDRCGTPARLVAHDDEDARPDPQRRRHPRRERRRRAHERVPPRRVRVEAQRTRPTISSPHSSPPRTPATCCRTRSCSHRSACCSSPATRRRST